MLIEEIIAIILIFSTNENNNIKKLMNIKIITIFFKYYSDVMNFYSFFVRIVLDVCLFELDFYYL